MKLPEFKSTSGVSMASAMTTPQLRSQTIAYKAPQHNLSIRAKNPEAEGRAAMAKYAVGNAVAQAVVAGVNIVQKIDDSSQQMAMEKAAAEYKYGMAEFTASEIMSGGQVDPNTKKQRHYGNKERYDAEKERLTDDILSRNSFTNKKYVEKFGLQVMGSDYVNTDNLNSSSQKHKIEKGKADYLTAVSGTNDTYKKIDLNNAAQEAGYITPAKAAENEIKYRTEGVFDGRTNLIDLDTIGADTINSIAAMKTDAGIVSVGGQKNADKIIERGVKKLGLIYADNAFGEVSVTGSKETLKRNLANYSNMTPEELGVETMGEKDLLLNVMEKEFTDYTRVMENKSVLSESDRKKMAAYQSFSDNNEFSDAGASPVQGAYSKENQGNYNGYLQGAKESGVPYEEMFASTESYNQGKFTWIDQGVIPRDVIEANVRQLSNAEPAERYSGAIQINRILTDPSIPKFLTDKMYKEVGEENAAYAAVIASSGGSSEMLEKLQETYNSPINREDGAANWNAWSDPKAWDSVGTLSTLLDEANYASDGENIPPAALNAFENEVKKQVESGRWGNGPEAFNNAQKSAFFFFSSQWGEEVRNGEPTLIRGAFARQAGGSGGEMPESAANLINTKLVDAGYQELADSIAGGSPDMVFAEQSRNDPNLYYLRVEREDGTVQTLNHQNNELQAVTLDSRELQQAGVEVRNNENSIRQGEEFLDYLDDNTPDQDGRYIEQWMAGAKDWFYKDFKKSKGDWKIIGDYFLGRMGTDITNAIGRALVNLRKVSPERAADMPIDMLQRLVSVRLTKIQSIIPDKEVNGIFWTRLMNKAREDITNINLEKKTFSPEQIEIKLKHVESKLLDYGLERP